MQKPNTNLILVNYLGGYGGDFFCNLLHNAIDPSYSFETTGLNKYETSHHEKYKYIKLLGVIIQRYRSERQGRNTDDMNLVKSVHQRNINVPWLWAEKMYSICYDKDPQTFYQNLKQAIRQELPYPKNNLVIANYHNARFAHLLDMNQIIPKSKNILLYTNSLKYHCLFDLLGLYKKQFMFLKQAAESSHLDPNIVFEYKASKQPIPPNDNYLSIDAGRLFFETGIEDQTNAALSEYLGCDIVLNHEMLYKYRKNNIKILNSLVGSIEGNDREIESKVLAFINDYCRQLT